MRTALCVSGVLRRRFPWISWSWRKRKEFLRRGATRRRILARCFGGSLSSSSIFPFFLLSLSFSLPLRNIARVYVCTCVCIWVALLSLFLSLLHLCPLQLVSLLRGSFALAAAFSLSLLLDSLEKPTASSVPLSFLSLLRISRASLALLPALPVAPFCHLAEQQLVAAGPAFLQEV